LTARRVMRLKEEEEGRRKKFLAPSGIRSYE